MKLPGHIARRVRALLEEVAVDGALWSVSPAAAKKEAGKLLPYFQGTRRKPPSKLPKSLQSRRPTKAKIHKENTRALRAAVMERADGQCELRGCPPPLQMHHLLGGSGRRREKQAIETCIAICAGCHAQAHHDRGHDYVAAVKCWADAHGYPMPVSLKGTARSAPKSVNSLAIKDTQS